MGIFGDIIGAIGNNASALGSSVVQGIQGAGALMGGQGTSGQSRSMSTEQSNNISRSTGTSWSESSAQAQANSVEDSYGYNVSEGQSTTYGREASAEDIQRAKEANELQREFWKEQADYNATEAQKARDYGTLMSNTAYQRAVADMIKAGINPILAAQLGGASTPSGVAATSGLATSQKATTYAQSESSNYSRGESTGHGESHSSSSSSSRSESKEEAYSQGFSAGQSRSQSITSNNFKDYINSMNNLLNGGGSAKSTSGHSESSHKHKK